MNWGTRPGLYNSSVVAKINRESDLPARALPGLLAGTTLVVLAADQGGYFASTWGWVALGLVSALAVAASLGGRLELSWTEAAALGALTALCGWTALSASWSSASVVVPEVERTALYLVAAGALMLVSRRDSLPAIAAGVLAAVTVIAVYSLATRLVPDRLGVYDPIATYRLSQPIGYWNALGLFVVIGALIALGAVARSGHAAVGAAAAAAIPVLVVTLYFTFSRGAWLALGVGLLVAIVLDRHPAALAVVAAVLAIPAAALVFRASRSDALTTQEHSLADAAHDGHRLIVWVVVLAAASAGLGAALRPVRDIGLPRLVRRGLLAVFGVAVLALLLGVAVRPATPAKIARHAWDRFSGGHPDSVENLNNRLFSLSSNGRKPAWVVALHMADAEPLRGFGAGTFEEAWNQRRKDGFKIVDAHNLYLEMLGELGAVGLALLLVVLLIPLGALIKLRREPLSAAVAAGYVAFLVHAIVDWDWEVPAVTLAGLFCGLGLLVAARPAVSPVSVPRGLVTGLAAAFAALAVFAQLGNSAVSSAEDAVTAGRWRHAESQARKARRWEPWSAEPWVVAGEARLGAGDLPGARSAFAHAVAKDPRDWHSWYQLALASRGRARRHALAQAGQLNPLSSEVAALAALPAVAP